MSNFNKKQAYRLQPAEKMSDDMLDKLRQINKNYSNSSNFSKYRLDLAELFGVSPLEITAESHIFLGGFLEGEASMNVSAKKVKNGLFGVLLDPEFSITQHVNGFATLYLALSIFRTGRIRHKTGSNATLVYVIDNRQSIEQKIIPFYGKYVKPYTSPVKAARLENFIKILGLFNKGGHTDLKVLRDEMLPIWDSMRMQKGQSNQTFASLEEAQQYVTNFPIEEAKQKAEEAKQKAEEAKQKAKKKN